MKTTTIYWSVFSNLDLQTRQNLLLNPIESLRKNLSHKVNSANNQKSYMACTSYHEYFKNTYVLTHPFTNSWHRIQESDGMFRYRQNDSAFLNSHLVDYDLQWVFFSEDSVIMEVMPAFLHRKESDKYGYTVAGSMDISKWFRAVASSWQLWEGVDELHFKENEPLSYVRFNTPNKVELKQFEMNEKLLEVIEGVVSLKFLKPHLSMAENYERFIRSKRHKVVLREIKNNLLD